MHTNFKIATDRLFAAGGQPTSSRLYAAEALIFGKCDVVDVNCCHIKKAFMIQDYPFIVIIQEPTSTKKIVDIYLLSVWVFYCQTI